LLTISLRVTNFPNKNNLRKINSILRFIIIKRKYLFAKEFNNKKEEVIKK